VISLENKNNVYVLHGTRLPLHILFLALSAGETIQSISEKCDISPGYLQMIFQDIGQYIKTHQEFPNLKNYEIKNEFRCK